MAETVFFNLLRLYVSYLNEGDNEQLEFQQGPRQASVFNPPDGPSGCFRDEVGLPPFQQQQPHFNSLPYVEDRRGGSLSHDKLGA